MQIGRPSVAGHVPALICGPDGKTYINPRKLTAGRNYWLRSDALALGANDQQVVSMTATRGRGADGDVELHHLRSESTGQFAVSINLVGISRKLMNRPVESSLVFGSGGMPAELRETLYVRAGDAIEFDCLDLSGSANTISIVAEGQRLGPVRTEEEQREIALKPYKHPYWLTHKDSSQVSVSSGGTGSISFLVPSNAYFLAYDFRFRASRACSFNISEGNESLMSTSTYIPEHLLAGGTLSVTGHPSDRVDAAALVSPFPGDGHLFRPLTEITLDIQEDSGAGANLISAAFFGQLLWFKEPADPNWNDLTLSGRR